MRVPGDLPHKPGEVVSTCERTTHCKAFVGSDGQCIVKPWCGKKMPTEMTARVICCHPSGLRAGPGAAGRVPSRVEYRKRDEEASGISGEAAARAFGLPEAPGL
jgi:hypothetical protein